MLATAGLTGMTGCSSEESIGHDDEHIGATDQALTADQCSYASVNGKMQICHFTGSTKSPYSILEVSESACINAHALHVHDYVTTADSTSPLYEPTCNGQGCLPEGAPCDALVACCDGTSCQGGVCTAL